jgi:hypothetical protein
MDLHGLYRTVVITCERVYLNDAVRGMSTREAGFSMCPEKCLRYNFGYQLPPEFRSWRGRNHRGRVLANSHSHLWSYL